MRQFDPRVWKIASRYSDVLASKTRDLAALIENELDKKNRSISQLLGENDALKKKNRRLRDLLVADAKTVLAKLEPSQP